MDFYISLAITVLLQVLKDRKQAKRVYPALAKVYVQTELVAQTDQSLMDEIDRQRRKVFPS